MIELAIAGLALSLGSTLLNFRQNQKSISRQEDSLTESMQSNYYQYMQQLESMRGDLSQNQIAVDQTYENIATNINYLDRWADEYDLTMQNSVDEVYGQYQQMASNLGAGLAGAGESGARGGSVGLLNASSAASIKAITGSGSGFSLENNRLGAYLRSTSLDMLADRQTALSAVETGYRSIPAYQEAMKSLKGSIAQMETTTGDMKKEIKKRRSDAALRDANPYITL